MIILGIDPGYDRLGLAIIEKETSRDNLLFSGCSTSSKKNCLGDRLLAIADDLEQVIKKWRPEVAVIEKLYFSNNQKTALAVAEARGLVSYLCAKNNIPIIEYTPAEIKATITGYGNANKKQIGETVPYLIKIDKKIKYDDEYDAIAIALTYSARVKIDRASKISTPKI